MSASAATLVDPDIAKLGDYDTASVTLISETGKQVVILNSRRARYGYDQRVEVHGATGLCASKTRAWSRLNTPMHPGFAARLCTTFHDALHSGLCCGIGCVPQAMATQTPPSPGGIDGLAALRLADAAERSARSGTRVLL